MKKYKASVRGENFLLDLEGQPRKYGFFTTRFVEAQDQAEVEGKVMALLRDDPVLAQAVTNQAADAPMMFMEEVTEVGWLGRFKSAGSGFSFYPEEEESKSS